MKFVSRYNNYTLFFSPTIPNNKLTGEGGKKGIFVRFVDSMVTVPNENEELINLMLLSPKYRLDFCKVEEDGSIEESSINNANRTASEPNHVITNIKYGTPEKVVGNIKDSSINKQQMELVTQMATEMAKKIAEEIIKKEFSKVDGKGTEEISEQTIETSEQTISEANAVSEDEVTPKEEDTPKEEEKKQTNKNKNK